MESPQKLFQMRNELNQSQYSPTRTIKFNVAMLTSQQNFGQTIVNLPQVVSALKLNNDQYRSVYKSKKLHQSKFTSLKLGNRKNPATTMQVIHHSTVLLRSPLRIIMVSFVLSQNLTQNLLKSKLRGINNWSLSKSFK